MIRSLVLPIIAIIGVILAAVTVVRQSKPPAARPPVIRPPSAPFDAFVAGSGLVEASSENIAVGTPVAGIVTEMIAAVGTDIAKDAPLFRIDSRELAASLASRNAQLETASKQLERLMLGTRAELIPPAEARLAEAEATVRDLEEQLAFWDKVPDRRAIAEEELARKRNAVGVSRTRVEQAKAELALLRAGTWAPDIAVAEAQLNAAQSEVEAIETEIERRTIRSPVTGRVLQVSIRAGEFAGTGTAGLVMVGVVDPLHIRVEIDEHEAWRLKPGSPAVGFVKGNKALRTDLTFVRFEPYVVPKRSLTGESTERVDTRVLQVLYSFDAKNLPVFIGQQMDVYIKADPIVPEAQPAPAAESPETK
ncbi:MAG: HlyD family secretion protein [Phycisphaerales bacterium]